MAKEYELLSSGEPLRIPETVDLIENTKDPQKAAEMAGALVNFATRHCVDAYSLLQLVDKAAGMAVKVNPRKRERNIGTSMLRDVNSYFAESPLVAKLLTSESNTKKYGFVLHEFDVRGPSALKKLTTLSSAGVTGLTRVTDFVDQALSTKQQFTQLSNRGKEPSYQDMIVWIDSSMDRTSDADQERLSKITKAYSQISQLTYDATIGEEDFTLPEKALTLLKRAASFTPEGILDRLNQPVAGVSLADYLLTDDFDQAAEKVLQFWTNMPQGDIVWRDIMKALFLNHPLYESPEFDKQLTRENSSLYRKLSRVQQYIGDNIYAPALGIAPPDTDFTHRFLSLLDNLDELDISRLASVSTLNWFRPFNIDSFLDTNETDQNTYPTIRQFLKAEINASVPQLLFENVYPVQAEKYIAAHRPQLIDSLRRFGDSAPVSQFRHWSNSFFDLDTFLGHKYGEFVAEYFMKRHPGYIERVDSTEVLEQEYWVSVQDEKGQYFQYRFNARNRLAGFDTIQIFAGASAPENFFRINLVDSDLQIVGRITDHLEFLNLKFGSEYQSMESILTQIILKVNESIAFSGVMPFSGGEEMVRDSEESLPENTPELKLHEVPVSRANSLLLSLFEAANHND